MTIKICSRCQQRYTVANHSGDYVHKCNSPSATLNNEDIPKTQSWIDYTGSGGVTPASMQFIGIANTLQGTRAGVEGEEEESGGYTKRGNRKSITRTRKHEEYIEGEKQQ